MENLAIDTKFNALPENFKKQVIDYIDFLFEKKHIAPALNHAFHAYKSTIPDDAEAS